jgi:hypothetical protein
LAVPRMTSERAQLRMAASTFRVQIRHDHVGMDRSEEAFDALFWPIPSSSVHEREESGACLTANWLLQISGSWLGARFVRTSTKSH